ncbi:MAG TPA: ribosome silencing factor [Burkholderiaceae bacterium]|nr:ribosome silencing factor [Burkholderiaceae bacterium]
MENRKLQRVVVDALEDVKAQDIQVFNTTRISDLFDRVVLASGTSNRHTRALAANVAEKVKHAGGTVVSIEGEEVGEWVLVDLGDVVVHIMQPAVRAYYALEEIWGERRVNVKLRAPRPGAAVKHGKSAHGRGRERR